MRKAKVYMHNQWAATIAENEDGFVFSYEENYLKSDNPESVSLTLPLSEKPYKAQPCFHFSMD